MDQRPIKLTRISIHALREEGDRFRCRPVRDNFCISIHALREEGDPVKMSSPMCFRIFLSTPSARRATGQLGNHGRDHEYFYPRPPRGGRLKID